MIEIILLLLLFMSSGFCGIRFTYSIVELDYATVTSMSLPDTGSGSYSLSCSENNGILIPAYSGEALTYAVAGVSHDCNVIDNLY